MQAHTVCMVLNVDVTPLYIDSNRVIAISARGKDTQAGYVDHFVIAVSPSNIHTFTAQPLIFTAYAVPYCMFGTSLSPFYCQQQGKRN